MYNSLPLASHKYTCMEGSTTASRTNQWTQVNNHCSSEKKIAATNGALVTCRDHTCPLTP